MFGKEAGEFRFLVDQLADCRCLFNAERLQRPNQVSGQRQQLGVGELVEDLVAGRRDAIMRFHLTTALFGLDDPYKSIADERIQSLEDVGRPRAVMVTHEAERAQPHPIQRPDRFGEERLLHQHRPQDGGLRQTIIRRHQREH